MHSRWEGNPKQPDHNRELLLWRWLFAIFLAGTSLALRAMAAGPLFGQEMLFCLGLLVFSLCLTQISLWAGRRGRSLIGFQLGSDVVCIALLIHLVGEGAIVLPLLFCVPILLGAYYLASRGALILASAAAVFTGGDQVGQALGWLFAGASTSVEAAMGPPILVTLVLIMFFLLLGALSGHMADRIRKQRWLQRQAAAQMQRAKSEVRNILDNISSGLLIVDQKGIITRANPSAVRILGLAADVLVGNPVAIALSSGMQEFARTIERVVDGGKVVVREEMEILRAGKPVPVGFSVSHLEDKDGNVIGAIAIFQDLTDVCKMQERIREADRLASVGELAASIAHEIRNPLSSIRGSVEILDADLQLEGHHAQLLDLILKESARVNRIINDFLAYARPRPTSRQLVNCSEFLAEVALQLKQHIGVHGDSIQLKHRVHPQDMQIFVDPEQMVQLFLNLTINACEAMDYRGEVTLAAELSQDSKWCELKVADSGPGIPAEHRADLFKPFVTTKKDGTGLGLPMVAKIAHAHGGLVEVGQSATGGALFSVRLSLSGLGKQLDPDFKPADIPAVKPAQAVQENQVVSV